MAEAVFNIGNRFRERTKKNKDIKLTSTAESGVRYPTGFLNFDFLNGVIIHVKDINTQEEVCSYTSVGILDGSYCLFVGRSGAGKTTLALQIAGKIIKPFKTATVFHDDVEGGIEDTRKYQLLGMTPQEAEIERRYDQRTWGITANSFFGKIKELYDERMENRDNYLYDTGYVDMINRKIYKLEPCVYILDSLALLQSDDIVDDDELSGGMTASRTAKLNNQIFRRLVPMIKSVNIILFVINHIQADSSPTPKKPDLAFLKMGEALPGGKDQAYLATNIFRIDDVEKLKEGEKFKIPGAIVEVQFVKARSSWNGRATRLVLDFRHGFDPELSLLNMLSKEGALTGSATYPTLADREDMKFTYATFKDKLVANPEMQKVFAEECFKVLRKYLRDSVPEEDKVIETSANIMNSILSMSNIV